MADATGDPTTNYQFKTLKGTDIVGYTSINSNGGGAQSYTAGGQGGSGVIRIRYLRSAVGG